MLLGSSSRYAFRSIAARCACANFCSNCLNALHGVLHLCSVTHAEFDATATATRAVGGTICLQM